MQYSIVNYKTVKENSDFRIDGEYYHPVILNRLNLFDYKQNDTLENLVNFVVGPFGSTVTVDKYVEHSNYRYIRNKDINNFLIKDDDPALIPKEVYDPLKQFHVKERDLLITVVGTLGKVAIAQENDIKSIFSCKSTILRPKPKLINPFYLLAYLNTKTGQIFSLRGKRGAIQEGLNLSDIKDIKVFLASTNFQNEIEKLVNKSFELIKQSKSLYSKAESLLLYELGLLDWKPKHQLSFIKNYSETKAAGRTDAEYFQPKYDEIIDKIKNYNLLSLSDKKNFDIITGTYASSYSDKGNFYIRSVDINDNLTIETQNMYHTEENIDFKFKVKTGDIVTSRVGSIGTLGIISEKLNNSFISDNILRIRNLNKKLDNIYLAFYLKKIGTILMKRLERGSVQKRLNQETLKEILIPIFNKKIQSEIKEKVSESFELREKSKKLLEIAKLGVEKAIEEDEETAEKWINEEIDKLGITFP